MERLARPLSASFARVRRVIRRAPSRFNRWRSSRRPQSAAPAVRRGASRRIARSRALASDDSEAPRARSDARARSAPRRLRSRPTCDAIFHPPRSASDGWGRGRTTHFPRKTRGFYASRRGRLSVGSAFPRAAASRRARACNSEIGPRATRSSARVRRAAAIRSEGC